MLQCALKMEAFEDCNIFSNVTKSAEMVEDIEEPESK